MIFNFPLLLFAVVYCALGVWGSELTSSTELSGVTGGPTSGEGLHSSLNEAMSWSCRKRRREKERGRTGIRLKAPQPEPGPHIPHQRTHQRTHQRRHINVQHHREPCTSSHLDFCIHGHCQYLEGLHEPVCTCMRGYVGLRCGIQTLETKGTSEDESSNTELIQTVLVIVAVVLSVLSCTAIILMTCAHYRSHKNFLASYLGSGGTTKEQEKLQKTLVILLCEEVKL
uniref:Amphiregulin n=1 Tax=Neogobius melanostomus TaxID=47308 RepID=A0A8C6UYW1_9GOBI